jgi:hypothetical protein
MARANPEGTGAQLSDPHERSGASHDPREGHLSQLEYSLHGQAGLFTVASGSRKSVNQVRRRAEFYYQQLDALRTLIGHDVLHSVMD